jgi:hypothetical protein
MARNTVGKVNPSAAKLDNENQKPMTGGTVPEDRSHVTRGPQSATRYNVPAPSFRKG